MRPAEDSEKDGGCTSTTDRRIAYALLRIVFGVNIFLHGISRLVGDHARELHDELVAFSPSDPRDPVR